MTEIVDPLRRGTAVARGEFVLDEAQAREKLREFQLVNPNYYILEFIKVAHLLGATKIELEINADELEMRFDGAVFVPEQLDRLHSAPFSQRAHASGQALRHMAIGVHAAQGLGLGELLVEVGGDQGAAYRLVGEEVERVEVENPLAQGTRILLRERFRPRHLLRLVYSARGRLPKTEILKERCGFSETPIIVNGERINERIELPEEALAQIKFENGSERGRLGITPSNKLVTTQVVHNGVLVSSHQRVGAYLGAHVIVDSPRLTLNLSQSALVEDAAFVEILGIVKGAMLGSLAKHLREMTDEELAIQRDMILGIVLPILVNLDPGDRQKGSIPDFLKAVAALPLFASATGTAPAERDRFWSIAEARARDWSRASEDTGTCLNYANRPFTFGLPHHADRPALVLPREFHLDGPAIFGHFADECLDVTGILIQTQTRSTNLRRWQESPWPVRPPFDPARDFQATENVGGLDVSVTWSENSVEGVQLCYVVGGRLLQRKTTLELGIDGLSIYISGELETDQGFAAPKVNAPLMAAWTKVRWLLEMTLLAMPAPMQFEVMLLIQTGHFHRVLNKLAGTTVWREGREPLDALGWLADDECFLAAGGRRWSARGLAKALETGEYKRILLLPRQGPPAPLNDHRLAGELVLILTAPAMLLITRLFIGRVRHVSDALESWQAANDREQNLREQKRREAQGMVVINRLFDNGTQHGSDVLEPGQAANDGEQEVGEQEAQAITARSAPVPAVRPVVQARPSPEQQFVALIRGQLRAIEGSFRALEGFDFSTLKVKPGASDSGHGLCLTKSVLDGSHPAMAHAREFPDDPVALAFVSSALYDSLSAAYFATSSVRFTRGFSVDMPGNEKVAFLDGLSAILDLE